MEATSVLVLDTARSMRVRLGLHQTDIAREAPLAIRTVSAIEAARKVRLASVERFARVLRNHGDTLATAGRLVDAMDRERNLHRVANLKGRASEFRKARR